MDAICAADRLLKSGSRLKFNLKRILEKQGTSASESERRDRNEKKGFDP